MVGVRVQSSKRVQVSLYMDAVLQGKDVTAVRVANSNSVNVVTTLSSLNCNNDCFGTIPFLSFVFFLSLYFAYLLVCLLILFVSGVHVFQSNNTLVSGTISDIISSGYYFMSHFKSLSFKIDKHKCGLTEKILEKRLVSRLIAVLIPSSKMLPYTAQLCSILPYLFLFIKCDFDNKQNRNKSTFLHEYSGEKYQHEVN